MAYRRKYRQTNGSARRTKTCYFKLTTPQGQSHEVSSSTHILKDAQAIERRCKRIVSAKKAGEPVDADTYHWMLNSAPVALLERLQALGIIDGAPAERRKPLMTLIDQHCEDIARRGATAAHVETRKLRIKQVCGLAGFARADDITAPRVDQVIQTLKRKDGIPASSWTRRHFAAAMRGFGKWLARHRVLVADPCADMESVSLKNRSRIHEPLTIEQFAALIHAAENSTFRDRKGSPRMPGPERALLYALAVHTGARISQLRALRVEHLKLEATPATILFVASAAKNRRELSMALIDPVLVDKLREHCWRKTARAAVFNLPVGCFNAWLRRDLEAAGVQVQVSPLRKHDFHGLRATTATLMIQGGADPRTVQERLAHADIRTTLGIYTHVTAEMQKQGLKALPRLEWST